MNLDRLYENGLLSRRGMNVCLANNLLSLDAIKAYHKRRSTFQNLNSCGEKLNAELMALTNKHDETTAILPSDPSQVSLEELTRIHKYARTHFGRRSKVVCKLNNLFTTGDIINHFKKFGTFTDLNKTGSQTTAELISICHLYQEINTEYRNKKDELRNKFAMRRTGFKQLDLFPSPQLNLFDGEQNDD